MRTGLGAVLFVTIAWAADGPSTLEIRGAAARGLALVQSTQKGWASKQPCVSCHQQILPLMAVVVAQERGVPYDAEIARTDAALIARYFNGVDRAVQYHNMIDPALSDGYNLAAAAGAGMPPTLNTAIYARHIAVRQKPDGRWVTGDARPPQAYGCITATALAVRALQRYAHPSLASDTSARVARAVGWLEQADARTTEDRTYRMFGLHWAGRDVRSFARELASSQRNDGGWGALDGRNSDAYSTGETLYALHTAGGMPVTDPAYQRGLQYLVRTQEKDGSWHVTSRLRPPAVLSPPYFEAGYPYGHDQFISAMGACWAVQALALALPRERTVPSLMRAASQETVEPWVETALFGSAAELGHLLDKGLDPNAATKAGGTTLLMMVQPDVEKTTLLLARGANVNARAKSKYSALMLAALYPGTGEAARLLLDRGAQLSMPAGAGKPMFNASPLTHAVFAGNAGLISRLGPAAGTDQTRMWLLGLFPAAPAFIAVGFDDVSTVRALLDAGASPNEADQDGFTLLYLAVVANHPETAKLLIERGAKVNAVDPRGMTPLLYAASADFGDDTMVRLLLAAGADPNTKTKDGLTASDLARKYGHSELLASLGTSR